MRYSNAKAQLLSSLRREVRDERVLDALAAVPREEFVPLEMRDQAYVDSALPIGEGQTISQPMVVAMMLQALELKPTDKVLEIGTGSGYQAALLGHLAAEVVTTERVPSLKDRAQRDLERLGYRNVRVELAGDVLGWSPDAPYDAIIGAAAAPSVPPVLMDQLAVGGRLVLPVGTPTDQTIVRVRKTEQGRDVEWLEPVRFVPLIGEGGWSEGEAEA